MKSRSLPLTTVLLVAAFASTASAITLSPIYPTGDTYLRNGTLGNANDDDANNSKNVYMLFGDTVSPNDKLRAILSFDLSSIPAGATINSVTLSVTLYKDTGTSGNTLETIELHQLTNSFNQEQATWNSRLTGTAWSTPGGDFDPTVIDSLQRNPFTLAASESVAFSNAALVSSVSSSLVNGSVGFMFKLATENSANRSIFRIRAYDGVAASSTTVNSDNVAVTLLPYLTIDYTPAAIPEPSSFAALAGLAFLGFAGARRRR